MELSSKLRALLLIQENAMVPCCGGVEFCGHVAAWTVSIL